MKKTFIILGFILFSSYSIAEETIHCDEDVKKSIEKGLNESNKAEEKAREKTIKDVKTQDSEWEKCLGLGSRGAIFTLPSIPGLGDWKKMLCNVASKPVNKGLDKVEKELQFKVTLGDVLPKDIDPELNDFLKSYKNTGFGAGVGKTNQWFDGESSKQKAGPDLFNKLEGKLSKGIDSYTNEKLNGK